MIRRALPFLFALILLAACSSLRDAGLGLGRGMARSLEDAGSPTPTATLTPTRERPTATPDLRPRYIVQSGDSMWAISARFGVSIEDIRFENDFYAGSALIAGMELIIPTTPTPTVTPTLPTPTPGPTDTPDPNVTPTVTPTTTPTATPDLRVLYTVQSGDSMWAISARFGITIDELRAANNLTEADALVSGNTLTIPVTPTATPTPLTRTPTPTITLSPTLSPTPTPYPFTPPAINPPARLTDWSRYLLDLTNERRFAHGVAPLAWSPELAAVAQTHAEECVELNECGMTTGDDSELNERLRQAGIPRQRAGMNWTLAWYPEQALYWWYDQPPGRDETRTNLISPDFTQAGIGMARNRWGQVYIVALFVQP